MKTESEYENIATEIVNLLAGKNLSYVEANHVLEITRRIIQYEAIIQPVSKDKSKKG